MGEVWSWLVNVCQEVGGHRRILTGRGNGKTTRGRGGCWERESNVRGCKEGCVIVAGDGYDLLAGHML